MPHVYKVASLYETVYFGTSKEAFRYRAGGDELPESCERRDAAAECNLLLKEYGEIEELYNQARQLLQELYEIAPSGVCASSIGIRAGEFIEAHPMAAVTCSDRDGGRSYGV